ncbi:hypothetical protein OG21DRAFT_1522574 [Imleria badia]|nr:hypothetical protein OG21DRAFT_1522574 [Imleria badia]
MTPIGSPPTALLNPSGCTKCNSRQLPNARNLVNTNVVKLFAKIDLEAGHPQHRQFAYYSSGIGTRPKSLHVFNRIERAVSDKFDMAIAWNMEEIVKDAYGWLARTYQEGDQIYLFGKFGFSRGAYQVRVLAGMIHEVGLIRTPTEKQIGTAWDHYRAIRSGNPKPRQIAREFKNTFSLKDVKVHFVGVWDTVSSVGLVRGDILLSTSASATHACHFRHALALDELRVKFMPEYFHEMNSQRDEGNDKISKYIVQKKERTDGDQLPSGVTENSKPATTSEIKEVWFAGSHSDVGGTNRPGKSYQAGNVSLLWMRREAIACGLILKPTDIVWVPDDLDFGTIDSMSRIWRLVEYLPIKHQVSFSGAGDDTRRWHRLHPRRIIPGQKVHASILFANAYKPRATLGEGFDIPVIHAKSTDKELDQEIWDTGMFDDTAAKELVAYLGGQQGVAPIYLNRLLFMLRFKEGRECVRRVPGWRETFESLIENRGGLVRLVTIVAYYEAAFDEESNTSAITSQIQLPQEVLDDAKATFRGILSARKHRDCPRVVALLRPLTRHQVLRRQILTPDVLQIFMELLDQIISQPGGTFAQAMDGLDCLLNCDLHHLTASLRVVVTLSRIQEALKPRLRELAGEREDLVGMLAAEALVALYNTNDEEHLNVGLRNPNFRANIAGTLVRLNPNNSRTTTTTTTNSNARSGYEILRHLFSLDAESLSEPQKNLIGELKAVIETGKALERTAATMTILKLCENMAPLVKLRISDVATTTIHNYLREIDLLDAFVSQLQRKDSALLAAYALVTCLKHHNDMKMSLKDSEDLPKHIIGMLRLDCFNNAAGQVEGFQIFRDFMRHGNEL